MKKKPGLKAENFSDYFPLGLAKAKSFCNRIKEQKILKRNIDAVLHTVLVSPRRYGKSSLAIKAIEESGLLYEVIDLFVAKNIKTIEKYILEGIERLISRSMSSPEQALKFLKTILKNLNAEIVIGTSGINIQFTMQAKDAAINILDALQALDNVLKKKETKAILFIDEFQQIGDLEKARSIEGAIRHVAQETRNIMFIFSGSNRHLLSHMFHDSNRPFYKLCHEIHLKRISKDDYTKYLNSVSLQAWNSPLESEALTAIFNCTEQHPYYLNLICMRIWLNGERPSAKIVTNIWQEYIFEERSKTANELNKLTANQYLILNKIAHGTKKQLTSYASLNEIGLPSASTVQALNYLEKNDYIYKTEEGYEIVDPLIKGSLLLLALADSQKH